jgi:hypothetical protein
MVLPVDVPVGVGSRMSARLLARMATTGIYLVRGVPLGLQRASRAPPGTRGPRSAGSSSRPCATMPREHGPHTPGTQCPSQPLIRALDQTGRRSRE